MVVRSTSEFYDWWNDSPFIYELHFWVLLWKYSAWGFGSPVHTTLGVMLILTPWSFLKNSIFYLHVLKNHETKF
jgi:hypothetical protein